MPQDWFIYKENTQYGPYPWDGLVEQARSGELQVDALVWTEGMTDWKQAGEVSGLFPEAIASQPPVSSAPVEPAGINSYDPAQNAQTSPPVNPQASGMEAGEPVAAKKKSPLKTAALIGGGVIALAVIAFVVLVVIEMFSIRGPIQLSKINTSEEITADNLPVNPEKSFENTTSTIYLTAHVDNAPKDTLITSAWFIEGEDDPFAVTDIALPGSSSTVFFSSKAVDRWAPGFYRVELSAGGELLGMTGFEIIPVALTIGERYPDLIVITDFPFAVAYPPDWENEFQDESSLTFTRGIDNLYIIVTLVDTKDLKDLDALLAYHKDDLTANYGATITSESKAPVVFHQDFEKVEGQAAFLESEYEWEGSRLVEWTALVSFKGSAGLQLFEMIYVAPASLAERYRPVAETIFESLTF